MRSLSNELLDKMSDENRNLVLWLMAGFIGMVMFLLGGYFTNNTGAGDAFIYGIIPSLIAVVFQFPGKSPRFALLTLAFPFGLVLFLATDAPIYLKLGLFPVFLLSPLVHFRPSVSKWSYLFGIACFLGAGLTIQPSIFMEDYITVRSSDYLSYGLVGAGLMIFSAFFTNPNLGGENAKAVGVGAGILVFLGIFSLISAWLFPPIAGMVLGMTKLAAAALVIFVIGRSYLYYAGRIKGLAGQGKAEQGEEGTVRGSKVDR